MPGSRRFFGYQSDNGVDYNVELDESIYETAALGFGPAGAARLVLQATASRPLKMRGVNCSREVAGATTTGKFYCGTVDAMNALLLAGTVTIDGVAWNVNSNFGEVFKATPATDTYLKDGDTESNFGT